MSSSLKYEQSLNNPIPRRGISLGLRLTIYMALIVSLVMGGVSLFGHIFALNNQYEVHKSLLKESLAPLAGWLESAANAKELRRAIEQFHSSYSNRGYPSHDVVLLDDKGDVIISTLPKNNWQEIGPVLKASTPVQLSILNYDQGTLVVLKDAAEYDRSVKRQWLLWAYHMMVTLVTIFLFLYPAIHFLVTKPIKTLVKGIQKMEKGYWGKVSINSGAWEIRWLAWRFENVISEVRKAVAHLLEAEQKAKNLIELSDKNNPNMPLKKVSIQAPSTVEDHTSPVYQELLGKCQRLESASLEDPDSVNMARKVWEEDSSAADHLGYWEIKSRLEDAALRLVDPETYYKLNSQLSEMKDSLQIWAEKCGEDLSNVLERKMIPCISIHHRVKHTAGVYAKMQKKGLDLDDIHDLYAFRVLVPTEPDCYAALGVLHQEFKPVIGRFKDYIAHPKKNGYQSLHTCVTPNEGPIFEIQIRSMAMHQHSEIGAAAHWVYKKNRGNGRPKRTFKSWRDRILRHN